MARHAAIARELRAVETLGSVSLLATDKTGTLTENRLVVVAAWTPAGEHTISGDGYAPTGHVVSPGSPAAAEELRQLARDAVLCNDAELELRDGDWLPVGDPTEAALVAFGARVGVDLDQTRALHPRSREIPFDSDRGWMLTGHVRGDTELVVVKGGPDRLLPRMSPDAESAAARAWCLDKSATGHRVLLVAETTASRGRLDGLPAQLELVGAVAMTDPPRSDVSEVVAALQGAGIRFAVMTGDGPATAARVAHQVGLDGEVVDAFATTAPDGARGLEDAVVYARVRPADKLRLVRRWQDQGAVVAVTGDGVNDGPALRQADIGVAMGRGGTEVARQAADLVLTDDRLETVVHAVQEGRRIQDNLRRFLGYALGGGLAEVLYVLAAPFFGFTVPLLPGQILWINMLTHGLPGVAMGAEPVAPDVLHRRPMAPTAPVLDRPLLVRVAATGLVLAATTLAAALLARSAQDDARTAAFLTLGLGQLGTALASRDRGAARQGRFLTVAVLAAAVLQVAGAWPPLAEMLRTGDLGAATWVWCLGLAVVPGVAVAAGRRRAPRDQGLLSEPTGRLDAHHRR
jgi:Ca2+-transporting ATPase